jgi:DNA-binding transcriptional regulator LsrR (DeoR family)
MHARNSRTKRHEEETTDKIVAYLSHLGLDRQAIAVETHMAKAGVSRALSRARQAGILGRPIPPIHLGQVVLDEICPKITDEVRVRKLESQLKQYGVNGIRVIPDARGRPDETFRRVAVACSDFLVQDLTDQSGSEHVIGFTWGRMLRDVIDAAELPAVEPGSLTLVPVSGELSILPSDSRYDRAARCSSNRLVEDLAKRLGLSSRQYWRFLGPATISHGFLDRPRELEVVWKMVERDPTVNAILGPRKGPRPRGGVYMIDRIETLFTGIGAFLHHSASTEFGTFDIPEEVMDELRASGIVGDLNGYLLADSGCDEAQARAEQLNQVAVGASPDDLKGIAERARDSYYKAGLGVVLAASGKQKARPVLATCRARAVNWLVLASDTAGEMLSVHGQ